MASAEKQYRELLKQLKHHDQLYYMDSKPEITDYEYDLLFKNLQELEAQHPELTNEDSPTQRVSDAPALGFEKQTHRIPMLSLQNTYNTDEILDFDQRVKKTLASDEDLSLIHI